MYIIIILPCSSARTYLSLIHLNIKLWLKFPQNSTKFNYSHWSHCFKSSFLLTKVAREINYRKQFIYIRRRHWTVVEYFQISTISELCNVVWPYYVSGALRNIQQERQAINCAQVQNRLRFLFTSLRKLSNQIPTLLNSIHFMSFSTCIYYVIMIGFSQI